MKNITTLIIICLSIFNGMAQDLSEWYEKLNPSVVVIHTLERKINNGVQSSDLFLGSGFLINEEGMIMTAAHVVQNADAILVSFADGQNVEAEVVSSITSSDVALIKVKEKINNPIVCILGNSDEIKIGEPVFVIGAPLGLEHSLSAGHVSGKSKRPQVGGGIGEAEFIQTDTSINHGNSGGPMFNKNGEVVGIVSYIMSQSGGFDGIGFAASINVAKKMLLEAPAFWTGFEGVFLNEELANLLNVPENGGLLVQHVVSNSMVAKMGLKGGTVKVNLEGKNIWIGGDIILNIQGQTCSGPHDFSTIRNTIDTLKTGENMTMRILRAGKIIEINSVITK